MFLWFCGRISLLVHGLQEIAVRLQIVQIMSILLVSPLVIIVLIGRSLAPINPFLVIPLHHLPQVGVPHGVIHTVHVVLPARLIVEHKLATDVRRFVA